MEEELRFHLDAETAENVRRGLAPEEARRRAAMHFGGVERVKEEVREARSLGLAEDLALDLRQAARGLARSRGFALTAIATLALGIGAATATFGVISGVLLRPLPFPQPERLVQIFGSTPLVPERDAVRYVGELRAQSGAFEAISGYEVGARYLRTGEGAERLMAVRTEMDFFRVMRTPPLLGRTYAADDPADVVVVSEDFWRRRLAADPAAVGRVLMLDGQAVTIIGVMPAAFQFPYGAGSLLGGVASEHRSEIWHPFERQPSSRGRIGHVIGRLRPGVSIAQAEAELKLIAQRVWAEETASGPAFDVYLVSLAEAVVAPAVRRPLFLLLGAVALVLLLACANVANLSLVRASLRSRELSVRLALGARRSRVVRELVAESLLLALAGGAVGLAVAWLAIRRVMGPLAPRLPRAHEVGIDWRVFLFVAAACALVTLIVGVSVALVSIRREGSGVLHDAGGHATMGAGQRRLRDGLLVAEVAVACLLAVGATVLLREMARLRSTDIGLTTSDVVTLHVGARRSQDDGRRFYEIAGRVAELPGVRAAGFTQLLPLQSWGWWSSSVDFTRVPPAGPEPAEFQIELRYVTPGYFEALGVPIRGRGFTPADEASSPPVILINEALARRYFGGQDPVGMEMSRGRVVGVVRDVRQVHLDRAAEPELYFPMAQNWSQVAELGMTLVVRSDRPPASLVEAIRGIVRAVDPGLAVFRVRTMEQVVWDSLADLTLYLLLLTLLAALALVLATGGAYGVIAYIAASRSRELAVRAAIGADGGRLARLVVGRGVVLVGAGLSLGVLGVVAATPLLAGLPIAIAAPGAAILPAALLVGLAGLGACAAPAWRAARAQPMAALRVE
jgi:predicted permease